MVLWCKLIKEKKEAQKCLLSLSLISFPSLGLTLVVAALKQLPAVWQTGGNKTIQVKVKAKVMSKFLGCSKFSFRQHFLLRAKDIGNAVIAVRMSKSECYT